MSLRFLLPISRLAVPTGAPTSQGSPSFKPLQTLLAMERFFCCPTLVPCCSLDPPAIIPVAAIPGAVNAAASGLIAPRFFTNPVPRLVVATTFLLKNFPLNKPFPFTTDCPGLRATSLYCEALNCL